MIVWVVGTDSRSGAGDNRLHGYDGDSGAVIYDGGGTNELMAGDAFLQHYRHCCAREHLRCWR